MSNDKMRAVFEAWCDCRHQNTTRSDRTDANFADGYMNLNTECFWTGWKASSAVQRVASAPKEKIAPVQGFTPGIPWSLHLEAYDAYSKKWAPQPAMIDLEGRNCRGGFDVQELDGFIPGWRDKVSEIGQLKARIAELEKSSVMPADPMGWALPCDVVIGAGTNRKGTPLSTLVLRMNVLHGMAMRNSPDLSHIFDVAQPAPELAKNSNLHDSLHDTIGQAINDEIASGAETPDWCDSREIDRLADAVLRVLPRPAPELAKLRKLPDARVPDLSRLVARLMRELKKADPAHELPMKAMDYLKRHDLIGSPLRTVDQVNSAIEMVDPKHLVAAAHVFEGDKMAMQCLDYIHALIDSESRKKATQ
jgi:hypothetical protein